MLSAIVYHTVLRCGSSPCPALFGATSSPCHPSLRRTHYWCCDAESGIRLCRACRVSLRGACSPCACAPSVLPYVGGSTDDCARPGSRIQFALSRRRRGVAVLYGHGAPARYEAVAPALLVETNPRAAAVAWYVCVTPPAASAASVVLPPTTLLPDTAGSWARLFRPLVCASQPASGSTRRT